MKPLLNGNDLGGWVGENSKRHDWITAKAVWWDPSTAPKMLGAKAAPGSRILNSCEG